MRILHLEANRYSAESLKEIESLGDLYAPEIETQAKLDTLLQTEKFDIVFTRLGLALGPQNLSGQKMLKYLVSPTTGLNHIDEEFALTNNIQIISLKGDTQILEKVKSTAEHTWALLMALMRNLNGAMASTLDGKWTRNELMCEELNGKTIGIIGYGRLGKMVAEYARVFDMKVIVCDVKPERIAEAEEKGFDAKNLTDLISCADVVILMASHQAGKNDNLIGSNEISAMKKGACFINTARGELLDEGALLQALENGKLSGAALDVLKGDSSWESEIPEGHPLINYAKKNNNLLITPHIGGYGKQSIELTRQYITQKLLHQLQLNNP